MKSIARRPPAKKTLLGLELYDAMVKSIAACQEIDELKEMQNQAIALVKYSKEAKNYDSELRCMDVRIRASQRAGELIAEGQKKGTIARPGGDRKSKRARSLFQSETMIKPQKLENLGITRGQSFQWQQLAGIKPEVFEEHLPVKTGKRTSIAKIIEDTRPKPDPAIARRKHLEKVAIFLWGQLKEVPSLIRSEKLADVVGAMTADIKQWVSSDIPKVREFLNQLEAELNR